MKAMWEIVSHCHPATSFHRCFLQVEELRYFIQLLWRMWLLLEIYLKSVLAAERYCEWAYT